jgi:hypothetical protein
MRMTYSLFLRHLLGTMDYKAGILSGEQESARMIFVAEVT